jgi:uracil-DNA glycosylase
MTIDFDRGFTKRPWTTLVGDYPGADVYPTDSFRVEWGPIFHRGRLDGSARVLIVGQDPATHETVCRRILVGEAGQRIQGMLNKLGIITSYLMINTFLYSVYGQGGGTRHIGDAGITRYRNRWINAAVANNHLDAIVTLGGLAKTAVDDWVANDPKGKVNTVPVVPIIHPTYPDSASASGSITKAAAFKKLCADWNDALETLRPLVTPDEVRPLKPYGDTITDEEKTVIPAVDLPAGLPRFMLESPKTWASRQGDTVDHKRGSITVTIPKGFRDWPVIRR